MKKHIKPKAPRLFVLTHSLGKSRLVPCSGVDASIFDELTLQVVDAARPVKANTPQSFKGLGMGKIARHRRRGKMKEAVGAASDSLSQDAVQLSAKLLSISENGICYALDGQQRTIVFRLNKVDDYSGESPDDFGLSVGVNLRISIVDGDVVSVSK